MNRTLQNEHRQTMFRLKGEIFRPMNKQGSGKDPCNSVSHKKIDPFKYLVCEGNYTPLHYCTRLYAPRLGLFPSAQPK